MQRSTSRKKVINYNTISERRLIDWDNSPDGRSPYTFMIKDLERIKETSHDYCFARKFDEGIDKEIIMEIYKMCLGEQP